MLSRATVRSRHCMTSSIQLITLRIKEMFQYNLCLQEAGIDICDTISESFPLYDIYPLGFLVAKPNPCKLQGKMALKPFDDDNCGYCENQPFLQSPL